MPVCRTVSAVVTRRAAASPALTATSGSSTTASQTALTRRIGGETVLNASSAYIRPRQNLEHIIYVLRSGLIPCGAIAKKNE